METVENRIVLRPDSAKLSDLRKELYHIAREQEVSAQTTRRLVLAVDEAVSNVIEHGLKDAGCTSDIEILARFSSEEIVVTIKDEGIPFDPRPMRDLDDGRRYQKRGFGLYLIQLIADKVEYERTQCGKNILTLTKRIA